MGTINVVLVDLDSYRRIGLLDCLSRETGIRVIASGETSIVDQRPWPPGDQVHVLLVTLHKGTDLRFLAKCRLALPNAGLLVLLKEATLPLLELTLAIGCRSVLSSDAVPGDLIQAVHRVSEGGTYNDPHLNGALRRRRMDPSLAERQYRTESLDDLRRPLKDIHVAKPRTLTPRQYQVVSLASRGLSNRQIAARLRLSSSTVAFHLGKAFKAMNTYTRLEAAMVWRCSECTLLLDPKDAASSEVL